MNGPARVHIKVSSVITHSVVVLPSDCLKNRILKTALRNIIQRTDILIWTTNGFASKTVWSMSTKLYNYKQNGPDPSNVSISP